MAIDLNIEGRHALLFDDDASAAFVNSRAALVPWTGDESLLIDRYDVRHLLDRIPPRSKKLRFVEDTVGVSQSELDRERFLDLPLNNEDEDNEDEETTERSEATGSGSYQAVPFSYGNNGGSADPNSYGQDHSSYHPPFSVPTSLISNLPPTEKLHQIIARTALFVSEHGGQSEIILRVKQGNNSTFGFLMPDNQLHPYFRFLVDHPHLLKTDNTQEDKKLEDQESDALSAAGGALSLLGSLYGTGEDDDNTHQQKPGEGEASKPNAGGDLLSPHKLVREEYAPSASIEDKETIKRAISVPTKERGLLLPKKNHFLNSGSITKKVEGATSQHGVTNRTNSEPSKTDAKQLILEPPSFLKKAIDKIVEFILKNGKEFEAVLIEQDKTAGRFPFLLSANPFNPYYLKVLEEAKESKSPSKKPSDKRKRRSQEPSLSESTADEELEDRYLDPQRKDKFKMTIGSKKESNDRPTEPIKRSGATTDEAAAIVLAATRGRSPAFQNSSAADSESAQTSNIHKQIPKPPVSIANAIAKTAAIATASEADSSEATLTKEQKLKAERLKRAKMFAAMIKSGVNPTSQSVHSTGTQNESVENHEEREGSSVPFDAEFSGKDRNYRKRHHSKSRDEEQEAGEDEDSDEDHKHSRKKHRKHHHRHHKHRHHHHQRHKHHSDSESENKHERSLRHRHRHRKHESSEDEERERYHKHRRKHRSPSEIEEGEIEVETKDAVDSHVEETDAKVSEITEVPSDLRAKIRAMLLETI